MKRKKLTLTAASVVGVLALVFLVLSAINSEGIDSVTVTFVGPGDEVRDNVVLGIGKEDERPDYRLDIVHGQGRHRCGTVLNRSAAEGITFTVADDISISRVQELVLVEDDKLQDDTVARVQPSGETISAGGYRFDVTTSRSFKVGLDWFFSTEVGKAISLGITIGIVVVILAMFFA